MKANCNIVRDLIPLVIDHAGSTESETLVKEHVQECEPCSQYMKELQADLSCHEDNGKIEQQNFDKVAQQMRRKRFFRILRNVMIGILVGILLVIVGLQTWTRLAQDYTIPVGNDEYDISLAQLTTGTVVVNVDYYGSYLCSGIDITEEKNPNSMNIILYFCNKRSFIKQYMATPYKNYSCMEIAPGDFQTIGEIRQGTPEEYCVVWHKGDVVTSASDELETYLQLEDRFSALGQVRDGKWLMNAEERQQSNDIQDQMDSLRTVVPEWNR